MGKYKKQTALLGKLVAQAKANNEKARRCITATKANKRIKDTLLNVVLELGENYTTVTNRDFAKLCNVSHATINNHGGIVAIKVVWFKKDIYRYCGYDKSPNLAMCVKHFYSQIAEDPRTIQIALPLGDSYFFIRLLSLSVSVYLKTVVVIFCGIFIIG